MEQQKTLISLNYTQENNFETERAAAEPLVIFALAMIKDMAKNNPTISYEWEGNGHYWRMELYSVSGVKEPILLVNRAQGNLKRSFRPVTQENWADFVRSVKVANPEQLTSLQNRIPEVKDVDFSQEIVECPDSIKTLKEPLLFDCEHGGSFILEFQTMQEFLDSHYPKPKPEPLVE